MDPSVPSRGSPRREGDNDSFRDVSKKRKRDHANSEDDVEEPAKKSSGSMRRPIHLPKRHTHGDDNIYNGDGHDEEGPSKPVARKRSRRSKANKYKTKGNEGQSEKEKENRERKISKYNQKIAEGKGPEKGSLGPKGAVRIRDGQMEFKDVNNPEWSKPDSSFTRHHHSKFTIHQSPSSMLFSHVKLTSLQR